MGKNKNTSLFDNDEEEDEVTFKTNKNYAKHYNEFRKKEVLSHLKNLENSDEESSSSSDESDAAEVVNPEFEKEFLKTMAFLKSDNPKKYKEIPEFFTNLQTTDELKNKSSNKSKKFTVADYEVKRMIETNGQVTVEEEIVTDGKSQREIEEDLKRAIVDRNSDDDDDDDDGDELFKVKPKTEKERQQEESEYLQWMSKNAQNVPEDLKPLKNFWTNPNLSSEDKFLRDYIVKKKYAKNDDENDSDYFDLSEDDEQLEKQEEFETQYNFRFEEGNHLINRHPRNNEQSLRIEKNKRKEARQERNERKQKEKELEMNRIREMRKIQKRDLEEKLLMIKEVAGDMDLNIDENFFTSEFDASKHDQMMQSTFGKNYYTVDEGDQKPEFPQIDEELEIENWDNFDSKNNDQAHCEDDDFNMDCEASTSKSKEIDPEILEATMGRKKRKKKSSMLAELVRKKKPAFDPEVMNKTYEEYLDEYYKLDFEDLIAGEIPCRFKYTECVPNDFGLSVEEILTATNKELNQWASLKKTMQNRPKNVEMNDVEKYSKRRNNMNLKKKIFQSIYGTKEEDEDEKEPPSETVTSQTVESKQSTKSENKQENVNKKSKKIFNKKPNVETADDRRLKTFSINPKKFKNKIKYGKKNNK